MAEIADYPIARSEQTELDSPIKVRWTGKLRSRVQERQWDRTARKVDGEWIVDPDLMGEDADSLAKCSGLTFRALSRQKTNVVVETVEEARAVYRVMDRYKNGAGRRGITWMNGSMENTARRVRSNIRTELEERGYEIA